MLNKTTQTYACRQCEVGCTLAMGKVEKPLACPISNNEFVLWELKAERYKQDEEKA